jgi:hypothetical protein
VALVFPYVKLYFSVVRGLSRQRLLNHYAMSCFLTVPGNHSGDHR